MLPKWQRHGTQVFLQGLEKLSLNETTIPQLSDLNGKLQPLTGFQAIPVVGYLGATEFFKHLQQRKFPTVTRVRNETQMDYLPEPDIFHDVAGHVPMHTDPTFAAVLQRFGSLPHNEAIARFFWFTIEFGLIEERGQLKAYGSGLMSSFGELDYALTSPNVDRRPFQLAEVMATPFEIDHFQNRLYVIESFDQLYDAVAELESSLPLVSGKKNTSTAPNKK
jgi:phenylalanine-4-hydroxylase